MLAGGVTACFAARGNLGHIDHRVNPGFAGGLREERGRLKKTAGRDRIAEVGRRDADHGGAHRAKVLQVAVNDFGPEVLEIPRPGVAFVCVAATVTEPDSPDLFPIVPRCEGAVAGAMKLCSRRTRLCRG